MVTVQTIAVQDVRAGVPPDVHDEQGVQVVPPKQDVQTPPSVPQQDVQPPPNVQDGQDMQDVQDVKHVQGVQKHVTAGVEGVGEVVHACGILKKFLTCVCVFM